MRATLLALVAVLAACGGGSGLDTPDECNPLGGTACVTPWPSSIYEIDDTASATGRRLDIPAGALPTNVDDIAIDPAPFNTRDGFSSAAPLITAFSTGVDGAGLVPYSNYGASVTPDSTTVLIDMSTGELVPHFAELDARAASTPDRQALYIRPAVMLKGGTRYAAAIKKTLRAPGGGELPVPEGFQAIVDGKSTSHDLLERTRPRYDAIFAALAQHGIAPADLVVAWDFTTASRESVRADLLRARDAALPLMGVDGANLTYTVTTNEPSSDPRIAARIDGEFDAPMFLNQMQAGPGTRLLRDGSGAPVPSGMYRAPFTAIIPQCALDAAEPVPMVIYGHGLLGGSDQVHSSGVRHAAAGVCMVAVGTDLRGMADVDVPNVALALNDANQGGLIFDTLIQGMINHVALVQIARGPMARDLFVKPGGATIVDPSRFFYYGISQGGIMGTTVCAIDPVIRRCVLQVGAINYSMMLERSLDWPTYRSIVIGAYPDPLDVALILNVMQMQWDRTEPTGVADVIQGDGFPGSPPKQVLMQIAIGDDEVANLASEYQARTMGIPTLTPSPYVPWGLEGQAGPLTSGLVLFDFGVGGTIPTTNEPPPDNEVHSFVRKQEATIDMMRRFLLDGEIVQTCTAANGCDCTAGGCGAEL